MKELLGAVLVAVGCIRMGEQRCRLLRRRVEVLAGLICALKEMELELRLRLTPLPDLMEQLGEGRDPVIRDLFCSCAGALQELDEEPFCDVWARLVDMVPCLEGEDKRALIPLGTVLGRYDGYWQSEVISGAAQQLSLCREQAAQTNRRMGRVYRTVAAAGGGFLIIFLL